MSSGLANVAYSLVRRVENRINRIRTFCHSPGLCVSCWLKPGAASAGPASKVIRVNITLKLCAPRYVLGGSCIFCWVTARVGGSRAWKPTGVRSQAPLYHVRRLLLPELQHDGLRRGIILLSGVVTVQVWLCIGGWAIATPMVKAYLAGLLPLLE